MLVRHYNKILVWENKRRLNKLIEFRQLVLEYFNNINVGLFADQRIENQAAQVARTRINRIMAEVHSIILHSGTIPILTVDPPPAVGGYRTDVDLIDNIFNLDRFYIGEGIHRECNDILNFIDRAIGIYESNHESALVRMFNPFFYLGLVFDAISDLPFMAIGKLGFNRQKAEASAIGRLVKGVIYFIPIVAAGLAILKHLELLGPVKQFVHELLGSSKAN